MSSPFLQSDWAWESETTATERKRVERKEESEKGEKECFSHQTSIQSKQQIAQYNMSKSSITHKWHSNGRTFSILIPLFFLLSLFQFWRRFKVKISMHLKIGNEASKQKRVWKKNSVQNVLKCWLRTFFKKKTQNTYGWRLCYLNIL